MRLVKTVIQQFPMNAVIRITGTLLEFNISGVGDAPVWQSVDLANVIANFSQDHGCIAIGEKSGSLFIIETTAVSVARRTTPEINTFNTGRGDSPLAIYRSLGGGAYPAMLVMTPFKGCTLADCTLYFFDSSGETIYPATSESAATTVGNVKLELDGRPLRAVDVGKTSEFFSSWLPISLQGPAQAPANSSIALSVSALDGADIYLEATAGALNRSRARNGDVITLDSTGLPKGTQIRIKAGYKFWPGKSDHLIDVT